MHVSFDWAVLVLHILQVLKELYAKIFVVVLLMAKGKKKDKEKEPKYSSVGDWLSIGSFI